MLLRRARGYAPLPLTLPREAPRLLAVGGHLKGAVAAAVGRQVFVSQHLGDLSTEGARDAFRDAIQRLESLYGFEPEAVACDLHPDYASTRHADRLAAPVVPVQHHHAHVLSCLADNGPEPPALHADIDPVVVERDEPGDGQHLAGGEVVRPREIGVRRVVA